MKSRFISLFLIINILSTIFLLGYSLNVYAESGNIVVEIRESSDVDSRKITLGQIADIEAPKLLKKKLESIDVGFAPVPGKTKVINGRQLESKIKSNKLFRTYSNKNSFDNLNLIIPEKVYIERSSQEISEDDLKALYEEYISERLNGQDFEIRDFSVRGLDIYPEGRISISPPVSNNNGELKGRVTVYVKIKVNNRDFGKAALSGWIDLFDDVVCASNSFTKGKIIEQGDVYTKRENISNYRGEYFSSEQDIIGKVLTRSLQINRAVTPYMVEDAALVHKGDRVEITAARGNLSIVTIGVVKSDGKINDTVPVQNMTSGKVINGVVTGKESVKVFY